MSRYLLTITGAFAFALSALAAEPTQEELDKQFAEQMNGVVMIGSWTVAGDTTNKLREERYEIQSVEKQADGRWLMKARIVYGKYDVTLPLMLPIQWAGDTAVITLTDFTIPTMGTFTSRVLIYRDRYAGTWQHDKVGGHLWGRIEKLPVQQEQATPTQ